MPSLYQLARFQLEKQFRRRLTGYSEALKKYKRPFQDHYVAYTDFTKKSMLGAVDTWLDRKEKPDAIYSMSDRGAIFIMMHLKDKKIRIPAQIAVAGYANDPMDEVIEPRLTSYDHIHLKLVQLLHCCFLTS